MATSVTLKAFDLNVRSLSRCTWYARATGCLHMKQAGGMDIRRQVSAHCKSYTSYSSCHPRGTQTSCSKLPS